MDGYFLKMYKTLLTYYQKCAIIEASVKVQQITAIVQKRKEVNNGHFSVVLFDVII